MDQDEINRLMAQTDDAVEQDNSEVSDDEISRLIEETNKPDDAVEQDNSEVSDDETAIEETATEKTSDEKEFGSETWCDQKIRESELPYPTHPEHKVVGQLSKVAQEGEEKASEIFDALLHSSDMLVEIQSKLDQFEEHNKDIYKFISALEAKFPNIDMFTQKLNDINNISGDINLLKSHSDEAVNGLYKAMETMQYQDISRQKIERVITVVRKLSDYLNNVFDIDDTTKDIKAAKFIHGDDDASIVSGDDIENLIKDFENND